MSTGKQARPFLPIPSLMPGKQDMETNIPSEEFTEVARMYSRHVCISWSPSLTRYAPYLALNLEHAQRTQLPT